MVKISRPHLVLAILTSALAGGYWVVGLSYSRGYDFFLWVYNAWVAKSELAAGNWPAWTLSAGSGQPVFKISGIADGLVLGGLNFFLDPSTASQVMSVGLYVLAGVGMYTLAHYLVGSAPGALVAATAYVFSWFMTYTAYYQAYLNNMLSYALVPWGALCFVVAVRSGDRRALLAAALALCVSILSNAQVSLKVALFVIPLGLVYGPLLGWRDGKRWLAAGASYLGFAVWWSAFLIAPALQLSQEVVVPGELRGNAFIPPWLVLFWVPLFGLNYLWYHLGGGPFLDREVLAWVIFSDYVGLSVVMVASCAWGYYRVHRDRQLVGLAAMLALYWAIYFGVVPFLQASSWVGRTHNWAFLPTLVLALLCAYGTVWVLGRPRFAHAGRRVLLVICGFLVLDLGGVSFFLNRLAITHTRLEHLPEVAVWRAVEAAQGTDTGRGRWFTFNPDHTHYLLPVMTGRPTANVIDLRARSWEYESYLEHQVRSIRQADTTYRAAESLGLLDIEMVDLPSKLYSLRGNDSAFFPRAVEHFESDPHLERVFSRMAAAEDRIYDAYDPNLDLEQITGAGADQGQVAQVVFTNQRHLPGFVPEHTVLLVGNTRDGERFFEGVTHLPGYRFDRVLFVLAADTGKIEERILAAFSGCIPLGGAMVPPGMPAWDLGTLRSLYLSPVGESTPLRVEATGEHQLKLEFPASQQSRFISISVQRFADWHARAESGEPLPAFKAGAGLSAVWVPAGSDILSYGYETPRYEQLARILSALGVLVALLWMQPGTGSGRLRAAAAQALGSSSRWRISKPARYIRESRS